MKRFIAYLLVVIYVISNNTSFLYGPVCVNEIGSGQCLAPRSSVGILGDRIMAGVQLNLDPLLDSGDDLGLGDSGDDWDDDFGDSGEFDKEWLDDSGEYSLGDSSIEEVASIDHSEKVGRGPSSVFLKTVRDMKAKLEQNRVKAAAKSEVGHIRSAAARIEGMELPEQIPAAVKSVAQGFMIDDLERALSYVIESSFTPQSTTGLEIAHARDLQGRSVRLLRTSSAKESRGNLQRIIGVLSRLDFPGIPKIRGLFSTEEDGSPTREYAVIDQVKGRAASQLVPDDVQALIQWIRVFRDAGLVVSHLHENHIVHGDISRDSICVTPDFQVWLTGFEQARDIQMHSLKRMTLQKAAGQDVTDLVRAFCSLIGAPACFGNERLDRLVTRVFERCVMHLKRKGGYVSAEEFVQQMDALLATIRASGLVSDLLAMGTLQTLEASWSTEGNRSFEVKDPDGVIQAEWRSHNRSKGFVAMQGHRIDDVSGQPVKVRVECEPLFDKESAGEDSVASTHVVMNAWRSIRVDRQLGGHGISRPHTTVFLCRDKRTKQMLEQDGEASKEAPDEYYPPVVVRECGWVTGDSLRKYREQKDLKLKDLLTIMRKAAFALAAIHDAGVIHGNVIPGNIIIKPDDDVRIVNFSRAIIAQTGKQSLDAVDTRPDNLIAPFMSPEQIAGKNLTFATDIYCLASILLDILSVDAGNNSGHIYTYDPSMDSGFEKKSGVSLENVSVEDRSGIVGALMGKAKADIVDQYFQVQGISGKDEARVLLKKLLAQALSPRINDRMPHAWDFAWAMGQVISRFESNDASAVDNVEQILKTSVDGRKEAVVCKGAGVIDTSHTVIESLSDTESGLFIDFLRRYWECALQSDHLQQIHDISMDAGSLLVHTQCVESGEAVFQGNNISLQEFLSNPATLLTQRLDVVSQIAATLALCEERGLVLREEISRCLDDIWIVDGHKVVFSFRVFSVLQAKGRWGNIVAKVWSPMSRNGHSMREESFRRFVFNTITGEEYTKDGWKERLTEFVASEYRAQLAEDLILGIESFVASRVGYQGLADLTKNARLLKHYAVMSDAPAKGGVFAVKERVLYEPIMFSREETMVPDRLFLVHGTAKDYDERFCMLKVALSEGQTLDDFLQEDRLRALLWKVSDMSKGSLVCKMIFCTQREIFFMFDPVQSVAIDSFLVDFAYTLEYRISILQIVLKMLSPYGDSRRKAYFKDSEPELVRLVIEVDEVDGEEAVVPKVLAFSFESFDPEGVVSANECLWKTPDELFADIEGAIREMEVALQGNQEEDGDTEDEEVEEQDDLEEEVAEPDDDDYEEEDNDADDGEQVTPDALIVAAFRDMEYLKSRAEGQMWTFDDLYGVVQTLNGATSGNEPEQDELEEGSYTGPSGGDSRMDSRLDSVDETYGQSGETRAAGKEGRGLFAALKSAWNSRFGLRGGKGVTRLSYEQSLPLERLDAGLMLEESA